MRPLRRHGKAAWAKEADVKPRLLAPRASALSSGVTLLDGGARGLAPPNPEGSP